MSCVLAAFLSCHEVPNPSIPQKGFNGAGGIMPEKRSVLLCPLILTIDKTIPEN